MPTQIDNALIRTQIIKTHDDGDQQKLEAYGRSSERFGGTTSETATPRLQNYGYSSYVPAESQGITSIPNGNPDMAMMTNIEHPKSRWKNLAVEGNIVEYDKWQHRRLKEEKKWTDKVGNAIVLMTEEGDIVHLNPPSILLAGLQVHRDGSTYSEEELAALQAQEAEAEANRQSILAEAQGRHDAFMARIDTMEQRIAQLESQLGILTNNSPVG
jgi:hypothetical protein